MNPINEYIAGAIYAIRSGLASNTTSIMMIGIWQLLPIIIIPLLILVTIAVIALVFGLLNYRTNKKILKKLEEKKGDG